MPDKRFSKWQIQSLGMREKSGRENTEKVIGILINMHFQANSQHQFSINPQ